MQRDVEVSYGYYCLLTKLLFYPMRFKRVEFVSQGFWVFHLTYFLFDGVDLRLCLILSLS
jgi:hypothetical protein